jgi:nitroimidazol reductase NimA-like FMN-containing flavoprotein (pyridoxamine 5'-phosphate oxidase superfamily)
MDRDFKTEITELMNAHQIMTIATTRRDGWPQATVVSYANEGLVLYSVIGRNTQKYLNIVRDPRVSVAISGVSAQPLQYKGLSLGGHATVVENTGQIERLRAIMLSRNPQYKELPPPDPTLIVVVCVKPEIVSLIDYSKGFGHSDLVRILPDQRVELVEAMRHHWAGRQAA